MPNPTVSFEFFPPSTLEGSFRLWDSIQTLGPLNPDFVSVTYGAGGTTRERTHDAVATIHKTTGLSVAAHLTCVNASREETMAIADSYAAAGVTQIVALRGDAPKGETTFQPHADGFQSSCDLISALAETGKFDIRVGAYPETHPEARSTAADIDYLKAKIGAGATSAITQFFFEAETFLRFRDACAAAGITAPILPGILPVENWTGVQKFARSCGAPIPAVLAQAFDNANRDSCHDLLAVAHASELCSELVDGGVDHLHFYTLNKPALTRDVCSALGLAPQTLLKNVA
jgi:methylenetetrahydrofolate reductase (NADPH)